MESDITQYETAELPFTIDPIAPEYLKKISHNIRTAPNVSQLSLSRRSEIYEQIAGMCCRIGELDKARYFFNQAAFANPFSESIYRKKLELIDTASLPKRVFSVVIPTFNRYEDLVVCIEHIRKNSFFPVQIVVVCDKCDDGTVEFLREENRKDDFTGIINEIRLGSVPSMKLGLYAALGDYISIINDDVMVMPGWDLEIFLAIDHDPKAGCAVPLILNSDGTVNSVGQHNPYQSSKYDWLGRVPVFKHDEALGKHVIDFPQFHHKRECDYGYFPVLKNACLHAIGFVDDTYRHYYVDPDIGYLVQMNGWRNIYCPHSFLVHHHRSSEELGDMGVQIKAEPDLIYFAKKWQLINPNES